MVSSWMPDVQVDIAFTSTWSTPAASRTWTDVSAYVELADKISIAFGRQDERATADANQLTLTLDNSDGRFTAGRAASPYSPNVKLGRPIRVRVTPPGGTTVTRFVGFVDEWPVEWDGSDAYAKATIRATSRLSRLGLTAKMRSMIEQEILLDKPTSYYMLSEPQGSTAAADASGNGAPSLQATSGTPALIFGAATGPGTDDLTAVTLGGGQGQYLLSPGEAVSGTAQSAECFMLRSGNPVNGETLLATAPSSLLGTNYPSITMIVTSSGVVSVTSTTGSEVTGTRNVCDGTTHHVAVTRSGATWNLYIDGVLDATNAAGSSTAFTTWAPRIGRTTNLGFGLFEETLTGVVAHAAFWSGATLSAARIAAHATAGLTGASGERTDQRLTRILGWAGVASTEITTETGAETMTYQKTSGQSFVDALREVESTEFGVMYDRADGNVGFHNRSHRYLSSPAATLNMAAQHVSADYKPKLDRSALVNDATVSNPTTDQSARATSTASSDEYGTATTSSTATAMTYDALQQKASWLIAAYSTPRTRVPSLTVDVVAHQGLTPSAQTLLGVTVGDLLAVTNAPTQADTTSPKYFVEGYTETIGPESYEISFNLSPTYPNLNTFVLDDATRGVLDGGNVLAL